ncbi:autotransporter outer membrane beta-barrel domain-containing protein [Caulobacter flavus]|uniref:autotransporter outer membrane beta-barrel domain-containing protein n=1 Tax=Caulobacter flavus TaxID=1679497 RepID=UPI0011AFBCFA|nr:autotransporter outer membrane beta-barrel domain-containing protein [Caulobacter flavus]
MSRRRRLGAAASGAALLTALSISGAMIPGMAMADGGSSMRVVAGAGPGGAGGVDGDEASAVGKDGSAGTIDVGSNGGGGGVNLQTGNGAHGGSTGASLNGTVGTDYGATGAMGAAIDTAQTITGTIAGATGGLGADATGTVGQADHVSASGHGGGGVGVSATADVTVDGGALVQGGAGGGVTLGLITGRGGGGGGVGIFTNSDVTVLSGGSVTGGVGGAANGAAGGGGGAGVVLTERGEVINAGVVTGGRGGNALTGNFTGGGGAGVWLLNGGSVTNLAGGAITGGAAGSGWPNYLGIGGAGVRGADITLVNAGAITGGNRQLGGRANAVWFTGGVNSLEIWSTSTITGNVQAFSAADRLILGGATNASFDVSLIGAAAQYRGFGGFEKTGASTWTLTGTNAGVTPWTLREGVLAITDDAALGDAAGALTFDGGALSTTGSLAMARDAVMASTGRLIIANAIDTLTLNGDLSGAGGLTKEGLGSLVLTGDNSAFTGVLTNQAGVLQIGAGGAVGDFAADIVNTGSLWTNHTGDLVLSGDITGTGGFVKYGSGRTVLTGNNGYRGSTSVEAGTLVVNGGRSISQALTVVRSGATLAGDGVIGGQVLVQAGGALTPGDGAGTLTINGNLTLQAGSFLGYELGQANLAGGAFNDLLVVGGALSLDGTLNVGVAPGGSFDPGLYRIISYGGALTGAGLTIGAMPTPEFFVQTSLAGQVNLVNSAGLSFRFWDGATGARNNGWVEGGLGLWQRSTGNDNWVDEGNVPNGTYEDGSFAVFGATGGRVTVDASLGAVETAGMQFVSDGYVIGGDALSLSGSEAFIRVGDGTAAGAGITATLESALTGSATLVKSDLGALVLSGTNSYTGGTTLRGGEVRIGADGALGAASGVLTFDGGRLTTTADLSLDRGVALLKSASISTASGTTATLNGAVSGSGALVKQGSGTLVLAVDAAYTGGTLIEGGALRIGAGGATGSLSGDVANDGLLVADRSGLLTLAGRISGSGGFVQAGSGVTVLAGANTYAGVTEVAVGTLVVNGDQSAATGLTSIAGGAALGGSGVIGGDVAVAAGGAIGPGNSPGTLTINGDLTLAQGALLNFELGAAGVAGGPLNDLIVVGGDLALDGTLNVSVPTGGAFDAGVYRLISYGGALTDDGLSLGTLPAGAGAYVHTGFAGQVNLVNTAGLTLNYWDGAASPGFDGVVGGGDGTWRAAGDLSWTGDAGAINAGYAGGAFAVFAGAAGVVTIDGGQGAVSASGLQFMTDGYRIQGDVLTLTGAQANIRVGDGTAAGAGMTATIASAIGGAGELVKTDLGALVLAGANSYAGATSVKAGGLYVNGDQSAASGLTRVDGGLLGGSGVIGGAVSVADGATLAPGGSAGAAGTLTINGGLSLSNGSILDFQLGQAGVAGGGLNDLLVVKGDLTLDGVLNVSQTAGGAFGAGVYRLVSYGGVLTDNGLRIGATPGDVSSYVQTSVAGQVNLVSTGGLTLNYWDGAGAGFDGVIAGGSGVWRAGGTELWADAGGAINAAYADGALAIFGGAAGTARIDDAQGRISAMGLQFATGGYRLEGGDLTLLGSQAAIRVGDGTAAGAGMTAVIAADLVGAAGLAKTDLGTLVLTGTNTYEGGTAINGGVLQVGADANLGAASGGLSFDGGTLRTTATMETARATTFTGAGRLDVAGQTTLTLKGAISGVGGFVKDGTGTLVVAGDGSAYAGRASVAAGALRVDGALGGVTDVMNSGRLEGVGRIGGLVLRSGGVVAPGGEGFGVLTVAGDFAADGGLIEIEAVLGGDGSRADRLVVAGATSGAAEISVVNRGGLGAQTQEGVKIVDVAGASNAQFALRGDYVFQGDQAVIAGAYAYRLYKNGVATPADGDWYLRSSLVDPETPTGPEQPQGPLYQPGAPIYEAYAADLLGQNGVGALRQRVGDRVWGQGATELGGAWGRVEGEQSRSKDAARSNTGADLKTDRWAVQMGYDRALPDQTWGGTLVLGASWRYGEAETKVRSVFGDGAIQTNAYGLGATATWYGQGGTYVDLQAQNSWYDSDLRSTPLGDLARGLDGSGVSLGVEVGKPRALAEGLQLTPQFQTVYSRIRCDSFEDGAGAQVWGDRGESLRSRFAAALARETEGEKGAGRLYGQVGVAYEWLGGASVMVSGTQLARRDDRLWGELAVGGSHRWRQGLSVFGEASAASGLNSLGDAYSVRANMGLRLAF